MLMAKETQAHPGTEAARKASLDTLREQESMRPVPSQEEADAHKLGVVVSDPDHEQPDGPAQRAADEISTRNAEAQDSSAPYKTRSVGRPKKSAE